MARIIKIYKIKKGFTTVTAVGLAHGFCAWFVSELGPTLLPADV